MFYVTSKKYNVQQEFSSLNKAKRFAKLASFGNRFMTVKSGNLIPYAYYKNGKELGYTPCLVLDFEAFNEYATMPYYTWIREDKVADYVNDGLIQVVNKRTNEYRQNFKD